MTESEIARIVADAAYLIYRRSGPGLLESLYAATLAYALNSRGLKVERQGFSLILGLR
jgi:GxxExxY protein